MTQKDVLRAKEIVEMFLEKNGEKNIYGSEGVGLYVNWTNKVIAIHGETSQAWMSARKHPGKDSNIFKETSNGFWMGPFKSLSTALGFAFLLKKSLLFLTHEETIINAVKINQVKFKFF